MKKRHFMFLATIILFLLANTNFVYAAKPKLHAFLAQGIAEPAIDNAVHDVKKVLKSNLQFSLQKPVSVYHYQITKKGKGDEVKKYISRLRKAFSKSTSNDYCYKFRRKTHRLACGMKAAFSM